MRPARQNQAMTIDPNDSTTKAVAARITGRVQGVAYRAFAREAASRAGLAGFARNEADGSVRVLAIGNPAAIEVFIAELRIGPPASAVAEVVTEEVAVPHDVAPDFVIQR